MRQASPWRALLGVENTAIEDVEFDEEVELVVAHDPSDPPRTVRGLRDPGALV